MSADANFDLEGGAKLRLMHPSSAVGTFNHMNATGALDVRIAHFGRFQTGTSITAPLFYSVVDEDGWDGCDDTMIDEDEENISDINFKGFVLVKDGGCTYEEKARNVQAMGASALLIAEDDYSFNEDRMFHDSWSNYDGSGTSIHIPTLLILYPYGDALIDLVE